MIYLCSCGFGTDDQKWLQGHLFQHPGHRERAASTLLVAALILADVMRNGVGGHPRSPSPTVGWSSSWQDPGSGGRPGCDGR
jgi:hypothetical protein